MGKPGPDSGKGGSGFRFAKGEESPGTISGDFPAGGPNRLFPAGI